MQHKEIIGCVEVSMIPLNKTVKQGNVFDLRKPVGINSMECRNYGNFDLNQLYQSV